MSKSNFEVRVVETRYGRRLLKRVGELLSAMIDAVFGKSRRNRQERQPPCVPRGAKWVGYSTESSITS
ncbi:MAG: hypothetical protein DRN06_08260 [Thermoprotei archaeon]|nr:MAG: hypothetical protein DRN06_08260 [Thermoprotei archaeon]